MTIKRIHVAVGVIVSPNGKILLSLRPQHAHLGGFWEFPGGKVEGGEAVTTALIRELQEELAITATEYEPLLEVKHDYSDRSVLLDVWLVTGFGGEPYGNEGQEVRWVDVAELTSFQFPAANLPIVDAVQQYFEPLNVDASC